MKQKRRKKLAKAWVDFQQQYGLCDELLKQARSLSHLPGLLHEKLAHTDFDESMSIADRISQLYRERQEERLLHTAAIESSEIDVNPKKVLTLDPQWAMAKKICKLDMDDMRMAKELRLSPKSLMNNIPNPGQRWKAPVKIWIRDLYEKRQQKSSKKSTSRLDSLSSVASSTKQPNDTDSHDELVIDDGRARCKEEAWSSHTED